MKIALVTERFLPHFGGVEFHVQALAAGLARRGHDVDVLAAEPSAQRGVAEVDGYHVVNFASGALVQGVRLPYGLMRSPITGYDLVHVHNYHSLALAVVRKVTAPIVLTPHFHGSGRTAPLDAAHRPYRALARRWIDRADAVICVSESERKRFTDRFPAVFGKTSVIPNPIRTTFTVGPVLADARAIVCMGRLEKYKRVDIAILAMSSLPGWRLTLIGDGPQRGDLERLATKHGVADRVLFTGRINDTAVGAHFTDASCVLQLSTLEAFGMATLEAIAAGRPVVVAVGGAPAELGDSFPGWVHICPSLQPEDVARAITRASSSIPIDHPNLNRFSPAQVVEDTLAIYERARANFARWPAH